MTGRTSRLKRIKQMLNTTAGQDFLEMLSEAWDSGDIASIDPNDCLIKAAKRDCYKEILNYAERDYD